MLIPKSYLNWLLIGQNEYFIISLTNQRVCKKAKASVNISDATVSKAHYDWLNKMIFHDVDQLEIMLYI